MSRESISPKLRFDVLKRDAFTCQYCGRSAPEVELHVDHVMPVAEGGGNDPDNLAAACVECNLGKSDSLLSDAVLALGHAKTEDEWIERMTLFVRSRFAGARPGPARAAIREALAWGCSADRLIFLANEASSWLGWLRQVYTSVGALMEREFVASESRERWGRYNETARAAVQRASVATPEPDPAQTTPTTAEVN